MTLRLIRALQSRGGASSALVDPDVDGKVVRFDDWSKKQSHTETHFFGNHTSFSTNHLNLTTNGRVCQQFSCKPDRCRFEREGLILIGHINRRIYQRRRILLEFV